MKGRAKSKAAPRPVSDDSKALLLDKLSGELRNHIWRHVLVSDEPVLVNKEQPHSPSLLRTCTQIRTEATSIFFNENTFLLPVDGYDSILGLK